MRKVHVSVYIALKEYGSNIQKLVDNIVTIEDREKRTRYAHILVELMRQIHPNMKDGQDYYNKLWDDLYIMSGFTLDVDSPYPPPLKEMLGKKPQNVPYNTHNLKFKHFGRNIELLIEKAISIEEPEEKRAFVSYLTRLMRTLYQSWNKESVEDETIYQSLIDLSKGRLTDEIEAIRNGGLIEGTPRERTGDQPQRPASNLRPYTGGFSNQYGNTGRDSRNQGGHRDNRNDRGRNDRGRNDNNSFRNRGNDRNEGRGRRR